MADETNCCQHSGGLGKKPEYDLWLCKHEEILEDSRDTPILDLGCGYGNNSLYLAERGFGVVSADIKKDAIENVRRFVPSAQTMQLDMLEGLPFGKETFRVVLADLCLHYFRWDETARLVDEIARVLKEGGCLLCRLNSIRDYNHGAGQGDLIETNYYQINDMKKRFFDRAAIDALFLNWDVEYICEGRMDRYKKPKMLWELALRKS